MIQLTRATAVVLVLWKLAAALVLSHITEILARSPSAQKIAWDWEAAMQKLGNVHVQKGPVAHRVNSKIALRTATLLATETVTDSKANVSARWDS